MGFFTGEEIKPVEGKPWFPDLNWGFSNFLSNWLTPDPNNPAGPDGRPNLTLYGASAFNPANDPSGAIATAMDYLRIPKNQNLQKAWDAWQPWDGGTQYLADYITNRSGADPTIKNWAQNTAQYGTMGGYGGELMHGMAQYGAGSQLPAQMLSNMYQYGGTGGYGNQGMSYAMQYGAPSQAGQYAANMAQFGVSSEGAGRALANRAYGQQTPSMSYLQPFMGLASKAVNYASPSIPTRQLWRNDGSGAQRLAPPVGYNMAGPYGGGGYAYNPAGNGAPASQPQTPQTPAQEVQGPPIPGIPAGGYGMNNNMGGYGSSPAGIMRAQIMSQLPYTTSGRMF